MKKSLQISNLLFITLLFIALLLLSSCAPLSQSPVPPEKQCATDADCIPASCCHSADAVNSNYAPDCADLFCTMECVPDTLDCGQGEIRCVNQECKVILFGV